MAGKNTARHCANLGVSCALHAKMAPKSVEMTAVMMSLAAKAALVVCDEHYGVEPHAAAAGARLAVDCVQRRECFARAAEEKSWRSRPAPSTLKSSALLEDPPWLLFQPDLDPSPRLMCDPRVSSTLPSASGSVCSSWILGPSPQPTSFSNLSFLAFLPFGISSEMDELILKLELREERQQRTHSWNVQ